VSGNEGSHDASFFKAVGFEKLAVTIKLTLPGNRTLSLPVLTSDTKTGRLTKFDEFPLGEAPAESFTTVNVEVAVYGVPETAWGKIKNALDQLTDLTKSVLSIVAPTQLQTPAVTKGLDLVSKISAWLETSEQVTTNTFTYRSASSSSQLQVGNRLFVFLRGDNAFANPGPQNDLFMCEDDRLCRCMIGSKTVPRAAGGACPAKSTKQRYSGNPYITLWLEAREFVPAAEWLDQLWSCNLANPDFIPGIQTKMTAMSFSAQQRRVESALLKVIETASSMRGIPTDADVPSLTRQAFKFKSSIKALEEVTKPDKTAFPLWSAEAERLRSEITLCANMILHEKEHAPLVEGNVMEAIKAVSSYTKFTTEGGGSKVPTSADTIKLEAWLLAVQTFHSLFELDGAPPADMPLLAEGRAIENLIVRYDLAIIAKAQSGDPESKKLVEQRRDETHCQKSKTELSNYLDAATITAARNKLQGIILSAQQAAQAWAQVPGGQSDADYIAVGFALKTAADVFGDSKSTVSVIRVATSTLQSNTGALQKKMVSSLLSLLPPPPAPTQPPQTIAPTEMIPTPESPPLPGADSNSAPPTILPQ